MSSFSKRKTQLNTSGSHRILDADGAFIGGVVYITGSMTASVGISASFVQGTSASFTVLSASLSGTAEGLPYIVAGPNITASYNSSGQWEITGSSGGGGGTPAGSNTEVQFNADGAFGASSGLSYYTASFDLYSPGTLVLASSSLSTVSGTNLNNNFTTTQNAFAESLQGFLSGQAIFSGSEPNIQLTASMLVVTSSHILVSRSFIVADGLTVSTSLAAAVGGGDYEEQAAAVNDLFGNQVGGLGGFLAQNGARYQLFENNWGLSDLGGDAPLFEVSPFPASQGKPNQGYLTFAGTAQFFSSSLQSANGNEAPFQITPANTQNQVITRVSGALNVMGEASQFTVISGSDGGSEPIFSVVCNESPSWGALRNAGTAEFVSGGVYIKEGASLHVQSGSGAAYSAFTVLESATADKVDVLFDKNAFTIAGAAFGGINTRPLYSYMTTGNATPVEMSGNLLAPGAGSNSVSKVDLNVIAVQKDTDNYASWLFSVVSITNTGGITTAIQCSELDTATSGVDAATWDVNVNTDNRIQCTGSIGADLQWYAQVTKKMSLSGSGLITA